MDKISQHFLRSEFACKCECGFDTVDVSLIELLEAVRLRFDRPITINSGCRCEAYNREIGGSENSQHMLGRAADFVIDGIDPSLVQDACDELDAPGLGRYDSFTHVDTRTGNARWFG